MLQSCSGGPRRPVTSSTVSVLEFPMIVTTGHSVVTFSHDLTRIPVVTPRMTNHGHMRGHCPEFVTCDQPWSVIGHDHRTLPAMAAKLVRATRVRVQLASRD